MSPRASTEQLLGDAEICPHAEDRRVSRDYSFLGASHERRELEKTLLRKLDLRIAFLVVVSIMNYMDRSNVASARLKGLERDLQMTGQQFNDLISVFYVGHILMQIPSNVFLNQLNRPSAYISCCIFVWGVISIGIGVSESFHATLIYRFLLGFSEAVFFPGVLFMLSTWYKSDELGLRMAYLGCGAALGTSFGSVIESGILATMEGKLGYPAWRWLFFIEGGFTCVIALIAFFVIPDFPASRAAWLTPEEHLLAQNRIAEDSKDIADHPLKSIKSSGLVEAFTDWTVWWLATAQFFLEISQSFTMFFPTIVATMGYSPSTTLLLCAPPQIMIVISSYYVSSHSDMTRDRFWHITGSISISVIGFIMAASTMNIAIRYISLFCMCHTLVSYIVLAAWANNSFPEPSKRAVVVAFLGVSMNIGDVVAAYMWPSSWGPSYSKSFVGCVLVSLAALSMLCVFRLHLVRLNRKGSPMGFRYIL